MQKNRIVCTECGFPWDQQTGDNGFCPWCKTFNTDQLVSENRLKIYALTEKSDQLKEDLLITGEILNLVQMEIIDLENKDI